MIKQFIKQDRGDTIVEVLISLAILVLVLGGAYYTANQSYRNNIDSQEHSEGLTIAQTQVEELRLNGDSFNPANDYCLQPPDTPSTSCFVASNNTSQFYPTMHKCLQSSTAYCYQVTITEPSTTKINLGLPPPSTPVTVNTYEVNVNWQALGGGTDNVVLYYRVDS